MSFPTWVWLFFGTLGSGGAVLFTLVVWSWLKIQTRAKSSLQSAARWNMIGLMFLFIAAYFACGIGGPPGSLLSHDPLTHDLETAYDSALLAIFFSVPGWACVLVGMRKMLKADYAKSGTRS